MPEKTIKLPSSEEIMKRLESVYNEAYMVERFYPLIAQEAGRQLNAQGVVMMFTLKIHDFVASGYPPVMSNVLHGWVPLWVDALVDDKVVAEAAKRFHQEAINAARSS